YADWARVHVCASPGESRAAAGQERRKAANALAFPAQSGRRSVESGPGGRRSACPPRPGGTGTTAGGAAPVGGPGRVPLPGGGCTVLGGEGAAPVPVAPERSAGRGAGRPPSAPRRIRGRGHGRVPGRLPW